jgi:hypothetical protein
MDHGWLSPAEIVGGDEKAASALDIQGRGRLTFERW